MYVSRLGNLCAAIVISLIQWAAFLTAVPAAQSERAVGPAVADVASDGSLPTVVITAHRRS